MIWNLWLLNKTNICTFWDAIRVLLLISKWEQNFDKCSSSGKFGCLQSILNEDLRPCHILALPSSFPSPFLPLPLACIFTSLMRCVVINSCHQCEILITGADLGCWAVSFICLFNLPANKKRKKLLSQSFRASKSSQSQTLSHWQLYFECLGESEHLHAFPIHYIQ